MARDREIVSRIRTLLRSGPSGPTGESRALAEQYAQRCAEVNSVLRQCDEYIARGMRTEAVNLAETPPPALDAAADLDFDLAPDWRAYCRESGLPVAEAIESEAVSRLNAAYMEEDSLSSLLTEYRRVARRGTLPEKISLLRRIARLDPDNPNWRADLEQHELARHEELQREAPQAIQAGDAEAMHRLAREMHSAEWSVAPPEELVARLDERLARIRREEAEARARALSQDIWDAYVAFDAKKTERLLQRWDRLLRQEEFTPAAPSADPVAEAREWLEKQKARQRTEEAFEKAQMRLSLALENGAPRADVESLFYEVSRFDRPYPDSLKQRTERAIEDGRRAEVREFRLKVAGVLAAVLAVALPIALFVRYELGEAARGRWAARIREAADAGEYDKAASLVEDLRRERPGLYAEAEFQDLAARVRRGRQEYRQRRDAFESVMDELAAIRQEGFPPDRSYQSALRMATRLAETESEKLRLEEWNIARRAVEERRRDEADRAFGQVVESLMETFRRIDATDPESESEAYRGLLREASALLNEARSIEGVSEALRAQAPLLRERLESHEEALSEARVRVEERRSLLSAIGEAMPDLGQARELAQRFAERFPDAPEAERLNRLARDCALGMDLERGLDWTAAPSDEMVEDAERFLESEEAGASFWKEPLERVLSLASIAEMAPQARESLDALRTDWEPFKVYSFVATHRQTGETTRYYFDRPFDVHGSGAAKVYRFYVYGEGHDMKHLVLPTERYEVEVEEEMEDNPAPHTAFVREMLDALDAVEPWRTEMVLLDRLVHLREDREISPFIRVYLMRAILREVRDITFENRRLAEGALEKLEAESLNVFWMDPDPDDETAAARRRVERLVGTVTEIPVMVSNTVARQRLHEAVFARRAKHVGWVEQGADGPEARRTEDSSELWMVFEDAAGRPAVAIAGGEGGELTVPEDVDAEVYDQMPLFGPTDGRTTQEALESVAEEVPDDPRRLLDALRWPRCWPVNGRDLPTAPKEGTGD